jgi:hypothetical protein
LISSLDPEGVVSEANDLFFRTDLLRTWNVKYLKEPSWTLCSPNSPTNSSSKTSPNQAPFSALFPMTTPRFYDRILEQFALEFLIGADKNSTWSNGNLVIAANHGPIHLLQAAFYAVRLEVQRRSVA